MSSWPLNAIACRHRHRHQHPCRPALFAAPWCATLNEACRRACSGGLQGPAVTTSRLSSRFSALQGARYAATGRAGPATGSKPCLCGWAVCSAGWNGIHQMLVCYAPRMVSACSHLPCLAQRACGLRPPAKQPRLRGTRRTRSGSGSSAGGGSSACPSQCTGPRAWSRPAGAGGGKREGGSSWSLQLHRPTSSSLCLCAPPL